MRDRRWVVINWDELFHNVVHMMYLHKPSTHNNAVKGGGGKKRKNKEADKIEHA